MLSPLKRAVHSFGRLYIRKICSDEYEQQRFVTHNERPIEYRFALAALAEAKPKTVLDVGTGTTAWPHLLHNCGYIVTAIDNVRDYWSAGMVNRHWPVLDVDILSPSDSLRPPYDAITCISVVEHIEDHERAVRNMAALLAPGGILILTTPYSHHHFDANVYARADTAYTSSVPYICRSSSTTELSRWLACGFELVRQELWCLWSGPVWATGERREWTLAQSPDDPHQLSCFLFRKEKT